MAQACIEFLGLNEKVAGLLHDGAMVYVEGQNPFRTEGGAQLPPGMYVWDGRCWVNVGRSRKMELVRQVVKIYKERLPEGTDTNSLENIAENVITILVDLDRIAWNGTKKPPARILFTAEELGNIATQLGAWNMLADAGGRAADSVLYLDGSPVAYTYLRKVVPPEGDAIIANFAPERLSNLEVLRHHREYDNGDWEDEED